jgi:homoserine dehydrogenase
VGEQAIRIGLIGFGTIGTGVVKLLQRQRAAIRDRLGVTLDLVRVADIDTRRDRGVKLARGVLVGDARRILDDPTIDIVIELMGGTGIARRFVLEALAAGKDVVSANKALLAHHGDEVFRAAEKRGAEVGFEASVGGGIPIIRTLKEGLCGDRNQAVFGIVNGTSNFILSKMSDAGGEFADVLRSAQADGLAEADPSFDVDGIDAAHKLTLLIQLAFGVRVPFKQISVEGIRHVSQADIAFAREFGCVIKSLAVAKRAGDRIEASVRPTMVNRTHPLADVNGALNAIVVHGDALGASMYVGAGAGMMPTATAVVADLMDGPQPPAWLAAAAASRRSRCASRRGRGRSRPRPCVASTTCASWWSIGRAFSDGWPGSWASRRSPSPASSSASASTAGSCRWSSAPTRWRTRPCGGPSARSTG